MKTVRNEWETMWRMVRKNQSAVMQIGTHKASKLQRQAERCLIARDIGERSLHNRVILF